MKKTTVIFTFLMFVAVICFVVSNAFAQGKTYKVGDLGPKGGWVFNDKGYYSDGWRYFEAAYTDVLNRRVTWQEAMSFCSQLGGKNGDWGLPGKKTLRLMFYNLRGRGAFFQVDRYWSQTQVDANTAWTLDFNMTNEVIKNKNEKYYARCVRAF